MEHKPDYGKQQVKAMAALKAHADYLLGFEGATGFGVGLRQKEGELLDEFCLFVEVEKKRPVDQLHPDQVIPNALEGFYLDVVEQPDTEPLILRKPLFEGDPGLPNNISYRPLQGGCSISNLKAEQPAVGTLGALVYVELGRKNKKSFVGLLSCNHVLYADGGADGTEIYQPATDGSDDAIIATNWKGVEEPCIDAAIARIEEGVETSNKVIRIGELTGVAFPRVADGDGGYYVGSRVRKYGMRTGFTIGQVTRLTFREADMTCIGITIVAGHPGRKENEKFASNGDSGAVVVTNENKVIGMVFNGSKEGSEPPYHTLANNIQTIWHDEADFIIPVPQDKLELVQIFADTKRLERYRELLNQSEQGRQLVQALIQHVNEGIDLVNDHRECMVAWQRHKGPQFISLSRKLKQDEPYRLEKTIEGISMATMINNMADLFVQHGSEQFAAAVQQHAPLLLQWVAQYDTVDDLVAAIGTQA